MSLKLRQSPYALYLLIFVLLVYATGILCTSLWIIESFTTIRILTIEPGIIYDAVLAASGITGVIGIIAGSFLLSLMTERRDIKTDRRQQQIEIIFPDRRTKVDRRAKAH